MNSSFLIEPRKISLLIVDEDQAVRDTVKAMIRDSEFTFWEAAGWQEAIEFAKRTRDLAIDLLLVDALVSPFNGLNLASQVHTFRPEIPALVMSDYNLETLQNRGLHLSPEEVLYKPFTRQTLIGRLRERCRQDAGFSEDALQRR